MSATSPSAGTSDIQTSPSQPTSSPPATSEESAASAAESAAPAPETSEPPPPPPPPPAGPDLSFGGRELLPGHLFVAIYGHPGTTALGVLGEQDIPASIARVQQLAAEYQAHSAVPVVPTFEIITTIATEAAGADDDYSAETDPERIRPWIEQGSAAGVYVLLDLQPGRTDFLTQAQRYADLLKYPNVGLALDPEWRLGPNQRHLEQVGGVEAAEVNQVITWLADFTASNQLPQKMLLLHQFRLSMLRNAESIDTSRRELALVIQMDGQGSQPEKDSTWASITAAGPPGVHYGWKNFYDEDSPTLSPEGTLTKQPTPVLVSYQ